MGKKVIEPREVERVAFLIWDGPLHDALQADRRYKWDKVLATARNILAEGAD